MTDQCKDEMPDEIWVGFTGDSRFPTYWATGQSLVGNERTKYTRAPQWQTIDEYKQSHRAVWITDGKNMELCHHKFGKFYNCYTDTLTEIVPVKFITIPDLPPPPEVG